MVDFVNPKPSLEPILSYLIIFNLDVTISANLFILSD